jgi:hypothetical protein
LDKFAKFHGESIDGLHQIMEKLNDGAGEKRTNGRTGQEAAIARVSIRFVAMLRRRAITTTSRSNQVLFRSAALRLRSVSNPMEDR